MAPPNDLLTNAEVIGKGYRTVTGTTVAAGFSDEGTAGYDQPSVWFKLDATVLNRQAPFWLKFTADYPIYAELYSVDDPTPDAEQLLLGNIGSYVDFFGDGTATPPEQIAYLNSGDEGPDQHFFVYVGNWDFDGSTGDFTLEICVPWSVLATDAPNLSSSTVQVAADAVGDTQYDVRDEYVSAVRSPWDGDDTFSCGTMPTGGKFYYTLRVRAGGDHSVPNGGLFQLARHGVGFIARAEDALSSTVQELVPCNPFGGGNYFGFGINEAEPLWVAAGDEITMRVGIDFEAAPGEVFTGWPEVLDVTFFAALMYPSPLSGTSLDDELIPNAQTANPNGAPIAFTMPELDLGATTELVSITVDNFLNPSTNVYDCGGRDFVVLPDGIVYLAHAEEIHDPAAKFTLALHKWDGASWTEITDNLWGHGVAITTYFCEGGVSMDVTSDGSYVYIAWSERDVAASESYWRCKRLDTSDDSLTELGPSTGTTHYSNSTRKRFAAWYGNGIRLRLSPAGVPWVAWAEVPTADINPPNGPNHNSNLPFLYYWDGSAWQDSGLPDPPTMRTDWWDTAIVEEPDPKVDFTFCHHDGASEYPSAIYNVQWNFGGGFDDGREWVYQEYDGASWGNALQKRANLIWTGLVYDDDYGHWHQGMSLVTHEDRPHLVAALGAGTVDFDYMAVCTIAADGSDFEALAQPFADQCYRFFDLQGWHPFCGQAAVLNGKLYVQSNHVWIEGQYVLGQGEAGDGTGWYVVSRPNAVNWDNGIIFLATANLKAALGKLWLISEDYNGCLGIWTLTPSGGVVSMNWRSSDRSGSAQRVLIGDP